MLAKNVLKPSPKKDYWYLTPKRTVKTNCTNASYVPKGNSYSRFLHNKKYSIYPNLQIRSLVHVDHSFENAHWRKALRLQNMWQTIHPGTFLKIHNLNFELYSHFDFFSPRIFRCTCVRTPASNRTNVKYAIRISHRRPHSRIIRGHTRAKSLICAPFVESHLQGNIF